MKYLMIIISMWLLIFTLGSCASKVEILPGLCYDDRNGTHMCGIICNEDQSICIDTDNPKLGPDKFPPQRPIDDIWEMCKPFLTHPAPAWSNCILIA